MTIDKASHVTRRGHGEGSIRLRSDGRWESMPSLPNGSRKSFYGKTRKEVQDKLRVAKRALEDGLDVGTKDQSVAKYLEHWLEEIAKPGIRPGTYRSYELHVRLHIIPSIGHIKLSKLTPQDVQNLLNAKARSGLSPRSVQLTRATLRRALSYAVKWSMVPRNVASLVDPPTVTKKPVEPLSASQVRVFLSHSKDDRLGPLFHVAIASGLRQGALFGLEWEDVDFDAGTLRVRHALQRIDGVPSLVETKTVRSRRTIPLPASALHALRIQQDRQRFERQVAGSRWRESNFVFTSTVGTSLESRNVTHRFQQLIEAAGLPRQRFHDLRHCCASLMLLQGVSARTVMETLGHSQIALTMNTYAHIAPELQRDAADRLDELLTESTREK